MARRLQTFRLRQGRGSDTISAPFETAYEYSLSAPHLRCGLPGTTARPGAGVEGSSELRN